MFRPDHEVARSAAAESPCVVRESCHAALPNQPYTRKHQCRDHKNPNAYTQKPQCRDHKNTNAYARKPHCLHTRCGRGPRGNDTCHTRKRQTCQDSRDKRETLTTKTKRMRSAQSRTSAVQFQYQEYNEHYGTTSIREFLSRSVSHTASGRIDFADSVGDVLGQLTAATTILVSSDRPARMTSLRTTHQTMCIKTRPLS